MRTSTRRKPTKRKPKGDDVLDSPYLWVTILICYVLAVAYCVFWVYGPSVTGLSQGKLPGSSEKAYFVSSEFATEDAKENENPYADTLLVDFIIGNRFSLWSGRISANVYKASAFRNNFLNTFQDAFFRHKSASLEKRIGSCIEYAHNYRGGQINQLIIEVYL